MRQVTRICDRCRAVLTDQPGSIVEVRAGDLVNRTGEVLDLCQACCDRFADWMRSGHQGSQDGPGGAIAATAVASMAMG